MRSRLLCLAALLAAAPAVIAADPAKEDGVILLSPYLFETPFALPKEKATGGPSEPAWDKFATEVRVRPNSADAVFFVYTRNVSQNKATLIVELRGGPRNELTAEGRVADVPAGEWKVVRFTKPAAPPAAAAPVPASSGAAPAPVEPPPPGVFVPRDKGGFLLTLTQYDEKDAKREKGEKVSVPVKLLSPLDYLTVSELTFADGVASVTVTPKAVKEVRPSDHRTDRPVTAALTFPGRPNGAPPAKAQGVFTRTLNPLVDGQKEISLGGSLPEGLERTELAIDGVERVAVFGTNLTNAKVTRDTAAAVRVEPVVSAVTKPVAAYPVRVETDSATAADVLELRLRRQGPNLKESDEVIPLGGPRDERVWVDVSEPSKQGLGFATKSADWVKAIDLTAARGKVTVEAALTADGAKKTGSTVLTVDAAAPETTAPQVSDDNAKQRVVKGTTVPVRATAVDVGEAGVEKVTFVFYSRLQDDGTFPPDAVKVDGERVKVIDSKTKAETLTDEWAAKLPLPADKKGVFLIAAVAADKAGNANSPPAKSGPAKDTPAGVKVIQLVDAPAGGGKGTVTGEVKFGGRPQPGLTVILGGPDGKAKATTTTDPKGKFEFKDVPAGAYTVVTAKPDTGKGLSGTADAVVEADTETKVPPIVLVRN